MRKLPLAALAALTVLSAAATLRSPRAQDAPPRGPGHLPMLPADAAKGYTELHLMLCGQSMEITRGYLAKARRMRPVAAGTVPAAPDGSPGGSMLVFANDDAEWAIVFAANENGACVIGLGTDLSRPAAAAPPPPSAPRKPFTYAPSPGDVE